MNNKKEEPITIPYLFEPRQYQLPFLGAMEYAGWDKRDEKKLKKEEKRIGRPIEVINKAVQVWHRRAGKEKVDINFMIKKMYERPGNYYYFFPSYKQGKKILWQGKDGSGMPFMSHFPEELILRKNDTELLIEIELENGVDTSIFQIVGTDDIDSVVGTNPVGCIFSEYSLQDPAAWNFIRPILAERENHGWAVFNFTPRGENHAKDLLEYAKEHPERWYSDVLTVEDTKAVSKPELKIEKEEMLKQTGDDGLYNQEYMCSFESPVQGSYYGKWMTTAEAEGRITDLVWEPHLLVDTWWDIGVNDLNTIWFTQMTGNQVRVIDYYENSGEGLEHYIKIVKEKKYVYGQHHGPHDLKVRSWTGGKTRWEIAKNLGFYFEIEEKKGREDGINAVRGILPRCIFSKVNCKRGINALKSYHKEYDERNKVYKDRPAKHWSNHASDAFRYLAMGVKDRLSTKIKKKIKKASRDIFRRKSNPLAGM